MANPSKRGRYDFNCFRIYSNHLYRTLVCGSHVYRVPCGNSTLFVAFWSLDLLYCREDVSFREQRQMFHLQLWPRLELRSEGNAFTYFKGNIA
jgi:hypothetical protein